ncbi:MAG: zinc ribbon domain-containing protein [Bryobacteraceae bacterium]|nr:zinc ribbon domain-containing protein [Bryobacteraceae bacterium]
MPIYEYKCEHCGAGFEKLMRSSEAAAPACPECGHERAQKQLSTFAAHAASPSRGAAPAPMGGCGKGMCPHPDLCGLN